MLAKHLLINQLLELERRKQTVLRQLAEQHTPPFEWRAERPDAHIQAGYETSIILYVGTRPAAHVYAGRHQLTKTPQITWENSWYWRMVGQDDSHRCLTREEGMAEAVASVNANKLAYVDPREWLAEPVVEQDVPGG